MLGQRLISFLKSINGITNTIILNYPRTAGAANDSSIAFVFDTQELGENEFQPVYLNSNLSDFLSVFSLYKEDYETTISDNLLTTTDGSSKSSFILSDKALITAPFTIEADRFDKIAQIPTVGEFDLGEETFKRIKQASGVFKELESIKIKSNDDGFDLSLVSKERFSQTRSNSYSLKIPGTSSKDIDVFIRVQTLFSIPALEYHCEVKYNSGADMFCLYLRAKDIKGFALVLSTLV